MMRRIGRIAATSLLLGTVALTAALGAGSSAAFADDDDSIGITVTVTPGPTTAPPAGTSGSSGSAGTSGSSGAPRSGPSSSGGSNVSDDAVAGVTAPPALADDEVDLGGVLYVSGLRSGYAWSANPLDGAAETSITVRNVSTSTFTSTVRFWANGPFGNQLSEVADVKVTDLKPGESRILEASLNGIGQSTFVQLHATLTPPKTVDGVELDAITRDRFMAVPPWGIASLVGLGALGFCVFSLVQFLRRPLAPVGLAGAPA